MDPSPPPPSDSDADSAVRHLRAEPRDSMFLLAVVRRPRGVDVAIKVRNLSPGGMMAECPSGFVRGEPVQVDLRGIGTVHGKVAWTASGRLGVQFNEAIDHRRARLPVGTAAPPLVRVQNTTWRPAVR